MRDPPRTPLRVVLQNFLNHIENLESQISPDESYEKEFQDLKLFSENVKTLKEFSCLEGEKEVNRKKNRYKDILPFDVSRVVLNEYAGIPGSDYINANFIKGASGSPAYIASQGPLPSTVNDFWRMVVQCEVQVIVMACNEEEAGKVKAKCERYWVEEGEEKQFGMITVKLLKASTVCPDFSVRTMRLKYTNSQNVLEERTVCQLHYVAWPDHGVPTVVQPLLDMVRLVRDTQASETLPVLVHCSAGCGRTGTICAIDYVWGLLRTGKLTDDFSLLSLIRDMRKQRIAMVQTKEQYVLVHQAVRELFKEQLSMIDSHPYENVDPNGLLIIKEPENEYDTIENLTVTDVEEKQDGTMEKDVAPPLPKKKHTLFTSKLEKEVENLSAQQRAAQNLPKMVNGGEKLVRSSADKSAAPMIPLKKVAPKPIPSKGILRVPQLESVKSASTVKRSKSLKVGQSGDKQRLVFSTDIPLDIKRRSSLESNVEEALSPLSRDTKDEKVTPKIHLKKYEALATFPDDRKLLVRSYTTVEMRHKALQDATPPKVVAHYPPTKVKLSRSNTQIDFARLASNAIAARRNQDDRHPKLGPQLRPLSVFPDPRSPDKGSQFPASVRTKPGETIPAFKGSRTSRPAQYDSHLYGSVPPPPTTSYEGRPAIKSPPKVDYKATPGSAYGDRRFYPRSRHLYNTPPNDPKYVSGPGLYPIESTPPKTYSRFPPNYQPSPLSTKTTPVKLFPPRPSVDAVDFASSSGSKPRPIASCKPFEPNPDWSLEQQKQQQSLLPPPEYGYAKRFSESLGQHFIPPKPSREAPVVESVKKSADYFTMAPGVDLDKVAASITQKDGSKSNLMKVALEAFNLRKTKQQKQDSVTVKGTSPAVGCSKKQQQYL